MNTGFLGPTVATVPTVYGIETPLKLIRYRRLNLVATVPTVYGIETIPHVKNQDQVHLLVLQQYLPFTVLKPITFRLKEPITIAVAAVLTAFGIETNFGT